MPKQDNRSAPDGATYNRFEGRVVCLTCELLGEPALEGKGYVVVELPLEQVRQSPVYARVTLEVPDHATHMGERVADLMREERDRDSEASS